MKLTAVLIALLVSAALSGCQVFRGWMNKDPYSEKAPQTYRSELTSHQLVAHINENIGRCGECGAWQCDRVKVKMTGIPAPLPATLAVRAPHSLRMRVSNPISGGDVLDLGSNDEYFWMWMRDGQATPVMTVRHDEFDLVCQSSPLPIPFHPDWLMEVLGVVPLRAEEFELVRPSGNQPFVDLVATRTTPDGSRVQRIVRVNPRHGLIVEHRLQKLNGELIGKASLSGYYQDPATHAVIPRVITVEAPVEGRAMALTLTFDKTEINPATLATADHLWQVPEIPGSPQVDLAQALRSRGQLAAPRSAPRSREMEAVDPVAPIEEAEAEPPTVREIAHERARPQARSSGRENPFARRALEPVDEPEGIAAPADSESESDEPLEPIRRQPRSRTIIQ